MTADRPIQAKRNERLHNNVTSYNITYYNAHVAVVEDDGGQADVGEEEREII